MLKIEDKRIMDGDRFFSLESQDLITLVDKSESYDLINFHLDDIYSEPLDEFLEEKVNRQLMNIFNEYGGFETCDALQYEFFGFTVVGITLSVPNTDETFTLYKDGYFEGKKEHVLNLFKYHNIMSTLNKN